MRNSAKIWRTLFPLRTAVWLSIAGLCLGSISASYAGQCVRAPESATQKRGDNSTPASSHILNILLREAPSGEYAKGMQVQYLGEIHVDTKKFYIVYTRAWFNNGTREIDRLVFFSGDWHYLGDYGEIYDPPERICGNVLYWHYDPKIGNKIELSKNGPPAKVVLDGEVYGFDNSKAGSN